MVEWIGSGKNLVDYLIPTLELGKWITDDFYKEGYDVFTGLTELDTKDVHAMFGSGDFGRKLNLSYKFSKMYGSNEWNKDENESKIRKSFIPEYAESIKIIYDIYHLMWQSKRLLTPTHVFGSQGPNHEEDKKYHEAVASFMEERVKEYDY